MIILHLICVLLHNHLALDDSPVFPPRSRVNATSRSAAFLHAKKIIENFWFHSSFQWEWNQSIYGASRAAQVLYECVQLIKFSCPDCVADAPWLEDRRLELDAMCVHPAASINLVNATAAARKWVAVHSTVQYVDCVFVHVGRDSSCSGRDPSLRASPGPLCRSFHLRPAGPCRPRAEWWHSQSASRCRARVPAKDTLSKVNWWYKRGRIEPFMTST